MISYRKFKKKYRIAHILMVFFAIILFWRAVWGILDMYLFPDQKLLGYILSLGVAFAILYFDDFHLKELE